MDLADYCLCANCGGKAFYDTNITDPAYVATYDPSEKARPIGLAVLCDDCNETHEAVIRPRDERPAPAVGLRDWFAGQALAGLLADSSWACKPEAHVPRAFDLADRMIDERARRPGGEGRGND